MEHPVKPPVELSSLPADQETRRQILTKAAELFLAKGYKGVSMKELAEAVQVTSAALYYHFPKGKEDLFTTMIQTVFVDEGVAGLDQLLATTQDIREQLTLLTSVLLTLPMDERLSMLLRDAREHLKNPEHRQVILTLLDQIRQHVMRLFHTANAAGILRTDLPINALVGLYMGILREAKSLPEAERATSLVSVLFDGIAQREHSPLP
ncbi:MAG: TetR/AcrR family transcriptional regulator [Acidobacteria bacterium]|nr:TetR/AcrR family transcriptional regulator [Acidobacteriota bacterium]